MRGLFGPFLAAVAIVSIVSSCQALMDGAAAVTEPATENVFRLLLALGVGLLLWLFIPAGEVARVLVALFGAFVTQAATTDSKPASQDGPSSLIPWYLDPSAYLRIALSWLVVAVALGLLWPRSRQQTLAALKDLATLHPIRAARRFLAGLGFLHSDPVPQKKRKDTP